MSDEQGKPPAPSPERPTLPRDVLLKWTQSVIDGSWTMPKIGFLPPPDDGPPEFPPLNSDRGQGVFRVMSLPTYKIDPSAWARDEVVITDEVVEAVREGLLRALDERVVRAIAETLRADDPPVGHPRPMPIPLDSSYTTPPMLCLTNLN